MTNVSTFTASWMNGKPNWRSVHLSGNCIIIVVWSWTTTEPTKCCCSRRESMCRTTMARNNGKAVGVPFQLWPHLPRYCWTTGGIWESTVKRRTWEHNISVRDKKCNMTDDELDEVLRQVKTEFPNAGYRRVHPQLLSRNIRVSHPRVWKAMFSCYKTKSTE